MVRELDWMGDMRKNEVEFKKIPSGTEGIDLRQIMLAVQSGKTTIIVTTAALFLMALLFCLVAQSYYTGSVDLVVDQRRLQVFGLNQNKQDNSVLSDAVIDNNTVDSLVSTISSDTVLARVAKKLDLASDPEFNGSNKSLPLVALAKVKSLFSTGTPRSDEQKLRSITTLMQTRLKVLRVGTSYVIKISYDSTTPTKAATIANAIADAFLEDQFLSSTETLQRASVWLEDRLKELQAKSAVADLAILKFRQDNQVELSTRPRELQVQLKNLDSTAQAYRTLYDTLLQRYNFAIEQQSLPSATARIVTRAVPPVEKSFPKTLIFLGIAIFLGFCLGAFICIVRSIFDSSVKTRAALSEVTGVDCVAVIPRTDKMPGAPRRLIGARHRRVAPIDVASVIYPEALERVKLLASVRILGGAKVITFASCSPGEGKTSCSLAFARLVARRGHKVLFIDGDLQNPNATRTILGAGQGAQDGGRDTSSSPRNVDLAGDVFAFLTLSKPSGNDGANSQPMLADLASLIAEARKFYDYIVVDLAPLSLSTDVTALESSIDGVFLVAEWGKTSTETLELCLAMSRSIDKKLYGAILNKADVTWLARAERDPTVLMHYTYGRGLAPQPEERRRLLPAEFVG
ncbi:hypothetical protein D9Y22_25355 [Methylorubrum sp. DB1722]|nr:hypothetical protein [Methylorubrum sp. DB1722]